MTRLFIRFKSFYLIISFLLVIFIFYPIKTFATNITGHSILIEGTGGDTLTTDASNNTRTIYSNIVNDGTQTLNTSIMPKGFYCMNSSCYSKVFNTATPLTIYHTVYWQSNPTTGKTASKTFYAGSSELLQLEITSSDIKIHPTATSPKVLITDFFKDGTKTLIGHTIGSGTIPNGVGTWTFPKYSFIVRSVSAPSISSFGIPGETAPYKVVAYNSFNLTWTVNQATATTRCDLYQGTNPTPIKTFDNTDTDTAKHFTLSGTSREFNSGVLTLSTPGDYGFKVVCTHNGIEATRRESTISVQVVSAPSVTKFLVKDANGTTLADGVATQDPELTVDYHQPLTIEWQGSGETCTGSSRNSEATGLGEWSASGQGALGSFQPTVSQTLTYRCETLGTPAEKSIRVKVKPRIVSFTSDKTGVVSDQNSVTFSWKVFNATECSIYKDGTSIHQASMELMSSEPGSTGSFQINITATSSFKLDCQNSYIV